METDGFIHDTGYADSFLCLILVLCHPLVGVRVWLTVRVRVGIGVISKVPLGILCSQKFDVVFILVHPDSCHVSMTNPSQLCLWLVPFLQNEVDVVTTKTL